MIKAGTVSININQLVTFFWAAELGSLSAAAKRLNLTQSTVSMRILKLEEKLQVQVFDRTHRAIRLTPKGCELFEHAKKLVALCSNLEEAMASPASLSGQVNIGVAELISITWLPRFMRLVHDRYPNLALNIDVALGVAVIRKLQNGTVDFTIGPGTVPISNVIKKSVGSVKTEWIASPSLGLCHRKLKAQDLAELPIIALSRESSQQEIVEEWFRSNKVTYKRLDTCNSIKVAAELTNAGLGISLLPPEAVTNEIRNGDLVILNVVPKIPPVEYFALTLTNNVRPVVDFVSDLAVEASDWT